MSRSILLAVIAASGGDRYYATEEYCTRSTDSPANTLFAGRLVDAVYERAVSFHVWNRAGGGQAISYLDLVNTDGALDSWLTETWRDVRITLSVVTARAAYSTATRVGVCVVDRIEAPNDKTIRFICRSVFERLEKTITNDYSTSVTNEQLRSKPKPITLGRVRWLEPKNWRLNDSAGSTRGAYDVADDFFESIVELRERGDSQDEANTSLVTNSSPEYFVLNGNNASLGIEAYGFLFREQDGRLAAEIRGQLRRVSQLVTNETFPSASGGNPAGWLIGEAGAGAVTWVSAGNITITGDGTGATGIAQNLTLTVGEVYQIEVDITSITGVISIVTGTTTLRQISAVAGKHCVSFVYSSLAVVSLQYLTGSSGTATIAAFRCYSTKRIASLTEIVRFAGVTRGSLSTGDLDLTALAAIDTATPYAIGWFSQGQEVRGIDLVTLAGQSFGTAIFQDASGKLKPVRIQAPAGSADFELDELSITSIGYEADNATGLSTKMEYGRNYAQHSADDVAGLGASSTTAIALLKAELQRDVLSVTTTETLHAIYADALDRKPLKSILSEQADAQDEIDRICALYTQKRAFYTLQAFVQEASAHTIEPGHTVQVTHSRYGLSSGVNLLVVTARSDFLGNVIDLVLWG